MTDPDYHVLTVTKSAVDTITACADHAQMVKSHWTSAQYNQAPPSAANPAPRPGTNVEPGAALESWSSNVSKLFGMFFGGESRVTKDGNLSLFVSTSSGFVYGVIFHQTHYRVDKALPEDLRLDAHSGGDTLMGRYCADQIYSGPAPCLKPLTNGQCKEHNTPTLVVALPVPGEWSFHS